MCSTDSRRQQTAAADPTRAGLSPLLARTKMAMMMTTIEKIRVCNQMSVEIEDKLVAKEDAEKTCCGKHVQLMPKMQMCVQ